MKKCVSTLEQTFAAVRGICSSVEETGRKPVVYIPGNAGRIDVVEQTLFTQASEITGGVSVSVFQTLALGPLAGWTDAVSQGVTPVTPFIGPGVRSLVNSGLAHNIRSHLSQVHTLFKGKWKPDIAFAHVSEPDQHGRVTLGLNAGLDIDAVTCSKIKVAVINSNLPRFWIGDYLDPVSGKKISCGCSMNLSDFDFVVQHDDSVVEHVMQPKDISVSNEIADHIFGVLKSNYESLGFLPTLQLGIGSIPNAVANKLAKENFPIAGIWSEMFSDGVLHLYEKGLIRKTEGPYLRNHIVVGFVLGTANLYKEMHCNQSFAVVPQSLVNDPAMIRLNDGMVSINSAIAVSLQGEVMAANIGKKHHSDVGGQYDFALGASYSNHGISIIALPSTVVSKNGTRNSKIVSLHEEGAHHTISADLPVTVVTEYGVADLRGLTDHERTEAMLRIACPAFKVSLEKDIRQIPAMQGVGAIAPKIVLLRSGKQATVRPAITGDIPKIQEYIISLSDKDRYSRYMGGLSIGFLTSSERMKEWYDTTLDYDQHAAFIVERDGLIIGVAHAFQDSDPSVYEISFSRRSNLEGESIGVHLMCALIDWAVEKQVSRFKAVTFRDNRRMKNLFTMFNFEHRVDEEDPRNSVYVAQVSYLSALRESATM